MTLTLGTIAEEAAACRAAFAARPRARYAAHVHHDKPVEELTEPVEERIAYTLAHKPEEEQALRLHCLRPATLRQWRRYDAAVRAARETYKAAERAARETYDAAVRPAWETYEAAERPARETYDAAVRPAWETYEAAERPAWETYEAAVRPAWETYEAAVQPAREVYDAVERAAHDAMCAVAECPWDGSIFPAAKA